MKTEKQIKARLNSVSKKIMSESIKFAKNTKGKTDEYKAVMSWRFNQDMKEHYSAYNTLMWVLYNGENAPEMVIEKPTKKTK